MLRFLVIFGLITGSLASQRNPTSQDELANAATFSVILDASTGYRLVFEPEASDVVCASGKFADSIDSTGWSFLEIHTNKSCTNEQQARAAGYFEGSMTAHRIYQAAVNFGCNKALDPKLQAFFDTNYNWLQQQIKSNPTDEYWRQVNLVELQLAGMQQGYKDSAAKGEELTPMMLRLLSLQDDVGDIAAGVMPGTKNEDPSSIASHCSALVKLLPDHSELFISQVTWSSFNSMLRTYKLYDFAFTQLNGQIVPAQKISFSSYPGTLFSGDDFYQMSSNIVSQETTIGVYDASLYKKFVKTDSVMEWTRNMVANRMASSAPDWCSIFSRYNSGSYNNEWMILDYNLFTPGQPLRPNTFWVLDQIPGYIEAGDLTDSLSSSLYFPSFNVAYWPGIFNLSGAPAMVKQYGNWFSHDLTARALIFKRDHVKVNSMQTMMAMMRSNDFKHDPLSRCDGCVPPYTSENSIACRDDLNPADGTWPIGAFGFRNHCATDAKIASKALMNQYSSMAISGPTYDQQPVFQFSTSNFTDVTRLGIPDRWEFPWMTISWN
jgi:hypothetical protein